MSGEQDSQVPVGRVPPRGESSSHPDAASGDAAYNAPVRRALSRGTTTEPTPRRLRRLHRVWPDRDGNISFLLTLCVDGRIRVLDNTETFERLVAFLLDSPPRYRWFGRRFVIMPDHLHLIAHQGHEAVRLGQWVKALKAVVGGLEPRQDRPVRAPGLQDTTASALDGRVPPPSVSPPGEHPFTRIKHTWRWQDGFHDHKFRTPESEARKWEYVCLNPVRCHLVARPEEWPYGGEIFYNDAESSRLIRGTPPLLEAGILIEADETTRGDRVRPSCEASPESLGKSGPEPPREGTRPAT